MYDQEMELREVLGRAIEVFGSRETARGWLYFKIPALGYRRPVDVIRSPEGKADVLDVLGRIEYGVHS